MQHRNRQTPMNRPLIEPTILCPTLKEVLPILEAQDDFSNDALFEALSKYVAEETKKLMTNGGLVQAVHVAAMYYAEKLLNK